MLEAGTACTIFSKKDAATYHTRKLS